jgi:C4-type Zn-finger protein
MTRRLSPIEMAIDRACGLAPGRETQRQFLTLECPQCGKKKSVQKDKTDPPNTARIVMTCNDCADDGDFRLVDYFDADGGRIT